MPTLYKPKKKEAARPSKEKVANVYNKYRNLRKVYVMQHPLCQDCLNPDIINEDGSYGEKITPVAEVHHIVPILTGKTELERKNIGLDPNNLVGLCKFHHHLKHKKREQS